jgi:hypothetical protein
VYADPALIQELEAYHHGAAAAHREHGPIPIALPAISRPVLMPQPAAVPAPSNVTAEPDALAGP